MHTTLARTPQSQTLALALVILALIAAVVATLAMTAPGSEAHVASAAAMVHHHGHVLSGINRP